MPTSTRSTLSILTYTLLLAALAGCGGGGGGSTPATPSTPSTPAPPPPTTLSVGGGAERAIAGGAAVPLTATSSDGSAIGWALGAGSPGSLSASSGTSVNYLPPASVAADTTVTITASANGASKSITLTLRPADYPRLEFLAGDDGGEGSIDGTGARARLRNFAGGAVDAAGNLYLIQEAKQIRKITPAAVVTTLASSPAGDYGYVDGARGVARLGLASCPAAGPDGSVYFVDTPVATGTELVERPIRKLASDGGISTIAKISTSRTDTLCLAADASKLYAYQQERISTVSFSGAVATLAGAVTGANMPRPVADGAGAAARFRAIYHVAVDGNGSLYVNDDQQVVRKVAADGAVATLAGAYVERPFGESGEMRDGAGAAARFNRLGQLAVVAGGAIKGYDYLLPSYASGALRTITPAGVVGSAALPPIEGNVKIEQRRLLSAPGGALYELLPAQVNSIGANGASTRFAGKMHGEGTDIDGGGDAARFNDEVVGMGADAAGNLYVADRRFAYSVSQVVTGLTLRKVTPAGVVTTIRHDASVIQYTSMLADAAGNVYVATLDFTIFDSTHGGSRILKIAPDGSSTLLAGASLATSQQDGVGAAARFFYLTLAGADADGNMYGYDRIPGSNTRSIRKITPAGVVSTVAALPAGVGVALDAAGNAYRLADSGAVTRTTPAGVSSVVAGVPGENVNYPGDLPGRLEYATVITRLGPYSFAVYSAGAMMRLYVPH